MCPVLNEKLMKLVSSPPSLPLTVGLRRYLMTHCGVACLEGGRGGSGPSRCAARLKQQSLLEAQARSQPTHALFPAWARVAQLRSLLQDVTTNVSSTHKNKTLALLQGKDDEEGERVQYGGRGLTRRALL